MSHSELTRKLQHAVDRRRALRRLRTTTIGLAAGLCGLLLAWGFGQPVIGGWWALGGVLLAALGGAIAARPRSSDHRLAAVEIERHCPQLDGRLVTALPPDGSARSTAGGYLQHELLAETQRLMQPGDWLKAVPLWRLNSWRAACVATAFSFMALAAFGPHPAPSAATTEAAPLSDAGWSIDVEPGSVEIERGAGVLVIAKFPGRVPDRVEVVTRDSEGAEQRSPLQRSLHDPVFGGRIGPIEAGLTYHVEFDGQTSPDYTVATFEFPRLVRSDVEVASPEYTRIPPKRWEDVRRWTLVEGAEFLLDCQLNKPVVRAELVAADGRRIELPLGETDRQRGQLRWAPTQPGEETWSLNLVDEQGRANPSRETFRFAVLPNQLPKLKVTFPGRDVRVSSLQELVLQAQADDDFGLEELGLVYETPDGATETIRWPAAESAPASRAAEHLLALESLSLAADDLLSYYFFARDTGPDSQARTITSDLFFAEVRPFEELFRQAPNSQNSESSQSQSAGEQNAGDSGGLLDQQREIVTAAWNVLRRELSGARTPGGKEDVVTLAEAQQTVLDLAEEQFAESGDESAVEAQQAVLKSMARAVDEFRDAQSPPREDALRAARASAQAAYRALLKLQNEEKNVAQSSQSRSGSRSASSRMNQQLQALQLQNDRNRYETERQAQQEQNTTQRETLQVLNRLRELARRQADLNERIQELELALRQADTPADRAELERQLKRLQEEQAEMLRNVEELQQRMDQNENRQQLADARSQLEQTRDQLQQANSALQQGDTAQAAADGARAVSNLSELQEEFRRQAAGQFDDQLRDLRENVRELAAEEDRLAEQVRERPSETEPSRPSLRSEPNSNGRPGAAAREELAQQFEQQQQRLGETLEQTRRLVQDAEASEPLLSKRLYDTMRELRKHEPEESLGNAARMARYGVQSEAEQLERQARRGIDALRSGVEDAAQSILGDDRRALEQARSTLADLTRAVADELNAQDRASREGAATDQQAGRSADASESSPAPPAKAGEQRAAPGSPDGTPAPENSLERNPEESPNARPAGRPEDSSGDDNRGAPRRERNESSPNSADQESAEARESAARNSEPSEAQSGGSQSSGRGQSQPSDAQSDANQSSGGAEQSGPQRGNGAPGNGGGDRRGERDWTRSLTEAFREAGAESGATGAPPAPLAGEGFTEWSDRMRDLEEMLPTPELRSRAAAIRDQARRERIEMKRHSRSPQWDVVRTSIYGPMVELESLIQQELRRLDKDETLTPIDRDPVPERYAPTVRQYFEELSRQRHEWTESH